MDIIEKIENLALGGQTSFSRPSGFVFQSKNERLVKGDQMLGANNAAMKRGWDN